MSFLGLQNMFYIGLFLFVFFVHTHGQMCEVHRRCESCIVSGCSWCKDENFRGRSRCMSNTTDMSLPSNRCMDVKTPGLSKLYIIKALPEPVLASPQKMKVLLQHGNPIKMGIDIRLPRDIRRKAKLLVKYNEIPSLNQTLEFPGVSKTKYKRKKNTHIFIAKKITKDSMIKPVFTIASTDCTVGSKNVKLIVRLMQKGQKAVTVKVKIVVKMKDCPCSCSIQNQVPFSMKCNGQGTWGCGECTCNEGYTGKSCELSSGPPSSTDILCMAPGSDKVCSGRGVCVEGFCDCGARTRHSVARYTGRFCQCDDYSCPYSNNTICGGPSQGSCMCGQCRCQQGFTGDACGCSSAVDKCMASNGKVCNGQGTCECGMCRCHGTFKGPTCEECPTCAGACPRLKPCVQCKVFRSGPLSAQECYSMCDVDSIRIVEELMEDEMMCRFKDDDDCIFTFSYTSSRRAGYIASVKPVKVCPRP